MNFFALVLILALCIPIVAFLVDSPIGQGLGQRLARGGQPTPGEDPEWSDALRRLQLLEGDVEILQHTVDELREENQFLRQLLEEGRPPRQLPKERG
jgi:hypothetical protein